MSSHDKMRPLARNKQVRVMWSRAPTGKAIIFVHGYAGETVNTWKQFDQYLPSDPKAAGYDLFFYGYEGIYGTMYTLSQEFCAFLTRLYQNAGTLTTRVPTPATLRPVSYNRVLVVAHSLGAILARWALVMAKNQGCTWMPNTELVLFAPAHNGARPGQLLRFAVGGLAFLRFFSAYAFYKSPLIDELDKKSTIFKRFRKEVREALKSGPCPYLQARMVIHANKETVVHNGPFEKDPGLSFPEHFANADHASVCKPTPHFPAPYYALGSLLP